ncbi:uncharacterized protein F4807DRAFT_97196 [Annulohypoxylon truncatum]|uniref:uncharacterized protein n=1 Tax=Annulohypoxylon truncatum TaxID=327061 RepID=UPI0020082E2B|nr:uncharacterized protein F4807DRAFT_97196 [Annulohypoxylon truncatum]KAI1209567.1 hypothetical protein F4807DRAFT_97196 [Annulohypoxylon truncatum]
MAEQVRSEIIRNNPIGKGLETFLASFNSLCESKDIPYSRLAFNQLDDEDLQNVILDLLLALQQLKVSRLLRFDSKTLLTDLSRLTSVVASNNFDFDRVKPLLRAVVAKEPDEEIWAQVYHAITESTPPPRSIASHLKQTPSSYNMVSIVNSSERRRDTDDVLKEDLGPMYVDIPGFHEAFFGSIPELESASQNIFQKCSEGPDPFFCQGWTGWPRDAKEPAVLSWLQTIIEQLIRWAQDYRPTPIRGLLAEPNKPLGGSTAKRKLEVGIVSRPEALADWSQILIPGELKSNPKEDRQNAAWFDIGKYVRDVFAAQDTRRFVLAFTLCGSLMRVWEFDRLGGIASTQFDINEDGLQFVSTILGFLWLEEKGLGFDPTFVPSDGERCIEIIRGGTPERIVIDEVMARVRCIAGRATTCWKAHPEGHPATTLVIKDSWQYPERDAEGELLLEVTEKGVCNVARYYYHETVHVDGGVDDVQHGIRKGLDSTRASNYQPQGLDTRSVSQISQISQSSTAGQKRSSSQTGARLPSSKRPRSESPIKVDLAHRSAPQNRIHRRVIVRDYGQNIYKASSPVALLVAIEGCIRGHESLLRKAGILHRDISINNLMVNEDNRNPSWPSFLIDLDLAIKEQRDGASGAKGKTGTRAFMAIGTLLGELHTFMHDLESFFWVLFWICIHYGGLGKGKAIERFEPWNYMNTEVLAEQKIGIITRESHFIDTFTRHCNPYYKSLIPWVNRLRRVVFDNSRQGADLALYSRMREVLREAQKDKEVIGNTASS